MAGCKNCKVGCPKCDATIAAFLRERRMDSRGLDRGYEISAVFSECSVEVAGDFPAPVQRDRSPELERHVAAADAGRERLRLRVALAQRLG